MPPGPCLEVGSGTGLARHAGRALLAVVAVDLSAEMLRRSPAGRAARSGDAARLPFASGSAGSLVLVNMLLFPAESDRVLGRAARWSGSTPPVTARPSISRSTTWSRPCPAAGRHASEAGWGTWAVLRRAG